MAPLPPLSAASRAGENRVLWSEGGCTLSQGDGLSGWELPDDRIVLALNRAGGGAWAASGGEVPFADKTAAFGYTGKPAKGAKGRAAFQASRTPGGAFLVLAWTRDALRLQARGVEDSLPPEVRGWLDGTKAPRAAVGPVRPLSPAMELLYAALLQPPVAPAAAPLWYRGKVLELLALLLQEKREPQEMFCSRQNRVARERVDKTMQILQAHLVDPPDLESLGSQVGCSPFYLSRLFSRETKLTIPQYLRELRMTRAADLLRAGTHNVTEAAMEVGYSSLSHFSKAFWEKYGCCPGLYPQGAQLFSRHNHLGKAAQAAAKNGGKVGAGRG